MKDPISTRKYARALLKAAQKEGTLQTTQQGLQVLAEAYRTNSLLRQALLTKRLTQSQKIQIVSNVFIGLAGPLEVDVLKLLVQDGAVRTLADVVKEFNRLVETESDLVHVTVYSADPLPPDDLKKILSTLQDRLGKAIKAHSVIDPKLLGGIKLRIGNSIVDGTLSRRLERIKDAMIRT